MSLNKNKECARIGLNEFTKLQKHAKSKKKGWSVNQHTSSLHNYMSPQLIQAANDSFIIISSPNIIPRRIWKEHITLIHRPPCS